MPVDGGSPSPTVRCQWPLKERMEGGDMSSTVSSASPCNPNATVVMNAGVFGPVFSLTSLTEENDKTDFCSDKFGSLPGIIADGSSVIVETSRGLVQLVSDNIGVGQVSLNNINSTNAGTLNGLPNSAHLQHTALLGQVDSFSHAGTPLFEVQTETVSDQRELHLSSPMVISHTANSATIVSTPTTGPEDEPKMQKRKGGWPKGKKRKKEKESNAPKAPATAYVLFAIERRRHIKETHPDLPFVEVTKILGSEWSAMSSREKQKYILDAEADKKRYMEQLKDYQHSDAYLSFLKRKKLKGICNDEDVTAVDGQYIDSATFLNELEEEGLYCKVCNQYFSSLHNRKEHMFGKQHLQAITSEFEKELQHDEEGGVDAETLVTSDLSQDVLTSESDQGLVNNSFGSSTPRHVDITGFIEHFLNKNCEREQEIKSLQQTVEVLKGTNTELVSKYQQYKDLETKMEQDMGILKAYQAALIAQIDGLRMVPTLFGVINFYISGKDGEEGS